MVDLNIRGVADDTKDLLDRVAAAEGVSTAAYVRRVLDEAVETERKRDALHAAFAEIDALHARTGKPRKTQAEIVQAVREVRDEYESGDAP